MHKKFLFLAIFLQILPGISRLTMSCAMLSFFSPRFHYSYAPFLEQHLIYSSFLPFRSECALLRALLVFAFFQADTLFGSQEIPRRDWKDERCGLTYVKEAARNERRREKNLSSQRRRHHSFPSGAGGTYGRGKNETKWVPLGMNWELEWMKAACRASLNGIGNKGAGPTSRWCRPDSLTFSSLARSRSLSAQRRWETPGPG